jgi:hypothetical protein
MTHAPIFDAPVDKLTVCVVDTTMLKDNVRPVNLTEGGTTKVVFLGAFLMINPP